MMKKVFLIFAGFFCITSNIQAQTVTDIDGNIYNTITVGTQVWMKENLKVTHYSNSDAIPNIMDQTAWSNLSTGALSYWGIDSASYNPVYGALYNWYAVADSRNVCPIGWHVPSNSEWNIMEEFLDNTVDTNITTLPIWLGTDLGIQLKDSSLLWSGGGGTNSSGFSGLPGGSRHSLGIFSCIGSTGSWWTSTAYDVTYDTLAWYRSLSGVMPTLFWDYVDKGVGISVRCVKDSSSNHIDENRLEKQIQIFPNPSNGSYFTVKSGGCIHTVEIFDAMGQKIKSVNVNSVRETKVSTTELKAGIYFVKIYSDNKIHTEKIILQ